MSGHRPGPTGATDRARAERVLWRAERLTRTEAEQVADAYPPPPSDPPDLGQANARAHATLKEVGFEVDLEGLSDRVDSAAMMACRTPGGMADFIHNFAPEAPLISAIHHAWLEALLGGRLTDEDRHLLSGPWNAVTEDPASDRFGPRTDACEAFILRAGRATADDADHLGRLWNKRAYDRAYELLRIDSSIQERSYGLAGSLACDAFRRALTGQDRGFSQLALDHPWRHASYLASTAAVAECLRDVVSPELLDLLEGSWIAVMGRSPDGHLSIGAPA